MKPAAASGFEGIGGVMSKRPYKIFFLIDTSGHMRQPGIMAALNRAMRDTMRELLAESENWPEIQTMVGVIKFNKRARWHIPLTNIEDFVWHDLRAGRGFGPAGKALKLLAKEMTVERMGMRAKPPAVVLISSRHYLDGLHVGLAKLLDQPHGKRAHRFAIQIGAQADVDTLAKFCSNPKEISPFTAARASELVNLLCRVCYWDEGVSVSRSDISDVVLPPLPPKPVTIGGDDADGVW